MLKDFQRVCDSDTLVSPQLAKVCPLTDSSMTAKFFWHDLQSNSSMTATCYYWQTFEHLSWAPP